MRRALTALAHAADAVTAGGYPYVYGGGVWPAGTGIPADNGVIARLRSERLIGGGTGTVTLYDKPGVHIFMSIDGRFFGTSDGGGAAR